MKECTHEKSKVYVRRRFSNSTIHYGVQCLKCKKMVKTAQHGGKLFIKHSEIPSGKKVFNYIEE